MCLGILGSEGAIFGRCCRVLFVVILWSRFSGAAVLGAVVGLGPVHLATVGVPENDWEKFLSYETFGNIDIEIIDAN